MAKSVPTQRDVSRCQTQPRTRVPEPGWFEKNSGFSRRSIKCGMAATKDRDRAIHRVFLFARRLGVFPYCASRRAPSPGLIRPTTSIGLSLKRFPKMLAGHFGAQ